MARRYFNFQGGTLSSSLGSGTTTLSSAGLADLPAVTAPDTVAIVIDPEATVGDPEIVIVTAHTAAATSATITRAAESTAARAHDAAEPWVVAATGADFDELPFRKVTAKGDTLAATGAGDVTRVAVGTNAYVYKANSGATAGVEWGQVETASIADSAVTTAKIADGQVTTGKIADGTISLDDLSSALIEVLCPAGTIRTTINTSADTGWLLFGQTVTNAQSLYPTLWAKAPSGWKSGSSLVLPSDADLVLRGKSSSIGSTSGANTVTLATANLPSHTHTIDHGHSASSGTVSNDHTHTFSGTTGGQSATHVHGIQGASDNSSGGGFGEQNVADWASAVGSYFGETSEAIGDHTHGYAGTTSGISANHTHSITVNSHSGSSGSAGSGTAVSVQEAGLNVRFQIKAH